MLTPFILTFMRGTPATQHEGSAWLSVLFGGSAFVCAVLLCLLPNATEI